MAGFRRVLQEGILRLKTDLCATKSHNRQQAAAAALHHRPDHVHEALLPALSGQMP